MAVPYGKPGSSCHASQVCSTALFGIVGRKSRAQFILRVPGGFFSVGQKQVSSPNEFTKKVLQRAISLIVWHEPHADAGTECHGLSDEPVSRNRVWNLHADIAES